MSPKAQSVTAFLNVDLDIRAASGLNEILTSIASSVVVLHQTEQDASIELAGNTASLEETVVSLVKLIESLAPNARKIWNLCEFRKFNIGVQAGKEPHAACFALSRTAISLLSAVQAEVVFTVYAPLDKIS